MNPIQEASALCSGDSRDFGFTHRLCSFRDRLEHPSKGTHCTVEEEGLETVLQIQPINECLFNLLLLEDTAGDFQKALRTWLLTFSSREWVG